MGAGWIETVATVSGSDPYVAAATFSSFSSFAVGNQNALPVELVDFSAKMLDQSIGLFWQTASETNNSHFDIQHSNDSKTWATIGQVQGKGTNEQMQRYTFEDKKPFSGRNYYRLMQVDYDGAFSYSSIVTLNNKRPGINVSPNPIIDHFQIDFSNFRTGDINIVLVRNVQGQLLIKSVTETNSAIINTHQLPAGIYIISIHDQNGNLFDIKQLSKL